MATDGRGTFLEVLSGRGWPPMASQMAEKWSKHPAVRNRAGAILGHFWSSLQWLWWLHMVVEVLGGIREAGGGGGWPKNGQKSIGKSARIRRSNRGV